MEVGELIIKTTIDNGDVEPRITKLKTKLEEASKKISGKFGTALSRGLRKVAEIGGKLGTVFSRVLGSVFKITTTLGLGLGVIGLIVAGVMILAKAFKKVFEENQQIKANLQYIVFAIGKALEPAVNSVADGIVAILNVLIKIASVIAYIISLLIGKNIFANASAEEFAKSMEEAQKSTAKTAKNAKEIKKQLSGFDEMNVLSDTSTSGAGETAGAGVTMPTINWSDFDVASEKAKGLRAVLLSIAGAIGAMKLSELLSTLGLINGELTIMQGLGIFLLIFSVYNIVKNLIDIWNKFDETLENNNTTLRDWGDTMKWVGLAIVGVGLIISSLPAVVIGAIVAIIAIIMKYWNEIKAFFVEKVFGWMEQMIQKLQKTTFGKFIAEIVRDSRGAIKEIINIFDGLFSRYKSIFDGMIMIAKGNFAGGLISIFKGTINTIISGLNFLISVLNTMLSPLRGLIVAFGKVTGRNYTMENIRLPQLPYLAKGAVINQPGRGIPVGSAYAGERGAEGVIPLTDSQQMALLGEAIGKYISINATVPVYVGNRLVMREMKRINAEDNFAFNK